MSHAPRTTLARIVILALAGAAFLPAGGATDLPPGAVLLPDGSVALPDVGEGPAWWTPEVREKARLAGERGMAYDFVADAFVDPRAAMPTQVLIRPGVQIFPDSIFPGWCTAAFTFGGETRISTAGHCTQTWDRVFALAAPSLVLDMGTTISSTGSGGIGNDWALIAIDSTWWPFVDSDVAYWGGPCGEHSSFSHETGIVKHVGHGTAVGTGGVPRVGLLSGLTTSSASYIAETQGGDSGSPVMLQRTIPIQTEDADESVVVCGLDRALAIHTHTSCFPSLTICTKYGTRIGLVTGTVDNGNLLPI